MAKIINLLMVLILCCSCMNNTVSIKDAGELSHITVIHENGQTIKEYRNNGRLYMVEVTPKHGKTYVIYPDQLNQQQTLYDEASPQGVKWKVKEF